VIQDTHPLLAKEGWLHIALTVFAAVIVNLLLGFWWSLPLWLAAVFVIQFFRDPKREIPELPDIVVAPADGKVVFVGAATDPYLNRNAVKISIFMNVFSVHSNRIPVTGQVERIWYTRGKFFNAELDKASEHNERNAIWLKAENGEDVVCVQVAGLIARRILCYIETGQNMQRGQRYGFIRFGSRVDLYLPEHFQSSATLGDWVYAGNDVLGQFVL
jgi:phosphatidylserine decarboxylase